MRVLSTVLIGIAALLAAGCGATGTAATVGDQTITIDELQSEVLEFSDSFDEPLPVSGDLADVQREFLTRQVNRLLLIDLADAEGVEITDAQVDELYDELAPTEGDIDALRAQFVYTEAGLRRALEDELRLRALEPIVGPIEPALEATAAEVGVEVNPRYGTWSGVALTPGTGSISVPAG
ncbi:MAG: SurA N-terminal domain-containing protein [Jiangellales bacterium]